MTPRAGVQASAPRAGALPTPLEGAGFHSRHQRTGERNARHLADAGRVFVTIHSGADA